MRFTSSVAALRQTDVPSAWSLTPRAAVRFPSSPRSDSNHKSDGRRGSPSSGAAAVSARKAATAVTSNVACEHMPSNLPVSAEQSTSKWGKYSRPSLSSRQLARSWRDASNHVSPGASAGGCGCGCGCGGWLAWLAWRRHDHHSRRRRHRHGSTSHQNVIHASGVGSTSRGRLRTVHQHALR